MLYAPRLNGTQGRRRCDDSLCSIKMAYICPYTWPTLERIVSVTLSATYGQRKVLYKMRTALLRDVTSSKTELFITVPYRAYSVNSVYSGDITKVWDDVLNMRLYDSEREYLAINVQATAMEVL